MSHVVALARSCEIAGPPEAMPLVLLHGSVVTRQMWEPQLRGLSHRLRVIAPDLPGHGARAAETFSFAAAAEAAGEVIRHVAGAPALVAGLSLGGYVAIELAGRAPDLFRGLVLSGCSVNFTGVLGHYLAALSWLMRHGWLRQDPSRLEARTRRLFPPPLAAVAEAQVAAGLYPLPLGAAFAEMAHRDVGRSLDGFPHPLLILNGERDRLPARHAATFGSGVRHREVRVLAGARHACSLDAPEDYNNELLRFAELCHPPPIDSPAVSP